MYHATCNSMLNYLVSTHSILESTYRSHIQCNIIIYYVPAIVQIRHIKKPHFKALQFFLEDHTPHINHYSSQNRKIIW